jgi:hypothetical protein
MASVSHERENPMSILARALHTRGAQITAVVILTALLTAGTVLAAISTIAGTFIDQVRVVRSTDVSATSSQAWVAITGAGAFVNIPAGTRGIILARYSAESACYTTTATTTGHWCSVRILLNDVTAGTTVEMDPAAGTDFAFDSTNSGREGASSWESHSMDRSKGPLAAGNYRVYAQFRTTAPSVVLRVDDWSLTVEKARA